MEGRTEAARREESQRFQWAAEVAERFLENVEIPLGFVVTQARCGVVRRLDDRRQRPEVHQRRSFDERGCLPVFHGSHSVHTERCYRSLRGEKAPFSLRTCQLLRSAGWTCISGSTFSYSMLADISRS